MASPSKRARRDGLQRAQQLTDLHRSTYVSQAAVTSVLKQVRDRGVPSAFSPSSQRRARQKLCGERTPFGAIVQDFIVEGQRVAIQHPFAMLWICAKHCDRFRNLLANCIAREPPSPQAPWGLVVYFDEVSPTNPLTKSKDIREVQCVYWTFLQFGELLWAEEVWFVLTSSRSTIANFVEGGMSNFLKQLLKGTFFDKDGTDISRSGVALDLGAGDAPQVSLLFAEHAATIADAKALVQILGSMGWGGLKPCMCCRNIVSVASGLATHDAALQPITSLSINTWKPHTDDSVRALLAKLGRQRGVLGPTKFSELETANGWRYNELSIVLDVDLGYRPISTLYFDWMHVYMVDGTYGREVDAIMQRIKQRRKKDTLVTYDDLDAYLRLWIWPRQFAGASGVCGQQTFSASASQTLSASPVLTTYFGDVVLPLGQYQDEIDSFVKLGDVVDILANANKGIVGPDDLEAATTCWLEAHLKAYGDEHFVYKHHQAMHLADMWRRTLTRGGRRFLMNCFALERHHKLPKRYMKDHLNTISYEKSVLEEVTLEKLHQWSLFRAGGLPSPREDDKVSRALREVFPGVHSVQVDDMYVTNAGARFMKKDVVLLGPAHGHACGEIWMHCMVDGNAFTCVSLWPLLKADTRRRLGKYRVAENPAMLPTADLHAAVVYKVAGTVATALWPRTYEYA